MARARGVVSWFLYNCISVEKTSSDFTYMKPIKSRGSQTSIPSIIQKHSFLMCSFAPFLSETKMIFSLLQTSKKIISVNVKIVESFQT